MSEQEWQAQWRNKAYQLLLEDDARYRKERRARLWGFRGDQGDGYEYLAGLFASGVIIYCLGRLVGIWQP